MKRRIVVDLKFLKKKSEEVKPDEVEKIIKDLEDTIDATKEGIGLSAVQIGILKRVAIIRMPNVKIDLINPIITDKSGRFKFKGERCLSLPGLKIDTSRYEDITIKNKEGMIAFYQLDAVAVQHEIDHMNGLLIIDKKWRRKR